MTTEINTNATQFIPISEFNNSLIFSGDDQSGDVQIVTDTNHNDSNYLGMINFSTPKTENYRVLINCNKILLIAEDKSENGFAVYSDKSEIRGGSGYRFTYLVVGA